MSSLNLVLYSGGQNPANKKLHSALSDLVGLKKKKSITYIPYCFDRSEVYYNRFKKRYSRFGFNQFNILHADQDNSPAKINSAFTSDAIYIAGGNTFYILHHLKKAGFVKKLKDHVKSGRVLAGLSAGAIIMTPDIDLAGYPEFDKDENEIGLRSKKSLGIVGFEFFPHFNPNNKQLIGALSKHASKKRRPIIASSDGCGVVIENGMSHFVGSNNYEFL